MENNELPADTAERIRDSFERIRHATAEVIENYDRQQIEYHNRTTEQS